MSLLKNLIINKGFTSPAVAFLLLPYLFLCFALGGLHENIFNGTHCGHSFQAVSTAHDETVALSGNMAQDSSQHDAATCQVCQWLKTPSTPGQIFLDDTHFDYVIVRPVRYSNPVIPALPLRKFTIRPPPSPCLFT